MRSEVYKPLYSDPILMPVKVSLISVLIHPSDGMQVNLADIKKPNRKITVIFRPLPLATRQTNESQRIVSLKSVNVGFSHFLNVVDSSEFIAWLNSESLNIYINDPLVHYLIIADDEWIDIISADLPEIISIDSDT